MFCKCFILYVSCNHGLTGKYRSTEWLIQDFVKGPKSIPSHTFPSFSTPPPLSIPSSLSHFPGFWGRASSGRGSSQGILPQEIFLKFNMRFGAFWCILANNLWLSSFYFREHFWQR